MRMNKSSNKFIASLMLVVLAGGACLTACAAYIFAWLATSPPQSDVAVDLIEEQQMDVYISMDGENWSAELTEIVFNNIFCGNMNRKTLYVKCVNADTVDLLVSLYFMPAAVGEGGDEIPYIFNNQYYYLGSQLQISDIRATRDGQSLNLAAYAVGNNSFLVTTSPAAAGQVNSVGAAIPEIPRLDILKELPVPLGPETVIEVDFAFADNATNQNVYQSSTNFVCRRRLMIR